VSAGIGAIGGPKYINANSNNRADRGPKYKMISKIISILAGFIITTISTLGYGGVFICMIIESACIPLPSEIIMPFSGYLVFTGQFTLWGTALAGALGNVVGSLAAYYAGLYLGRDFVMKNGKYLLISQKDVLRAETWFQKFGNPAIFFSRLLPIIRTFISFPAGVARMPIVPFILYTFFGSLPWCYGLAFVGMKTGEHWDTLGKYFHQFDVVIAILILLGLVYWIKHHLKFREM